MPTGHDIVWQFLGPDEISAQSVRIAENQRLARGGEKTRPGRPRKAG
jgi:hypothetical protein